MKSFSLPRPLADALSVLRPSPWAARRAAGALAAAVVAAGLAAALSLWWLPAVAAAVAAATAALSLALVGPLRLATRPPMAPPAAELPPGAVLHAVDPATGLATQPHFLEMFDREWARARRYGVGAALAIIELDAGPMPASESGGANHDAALAALAREVRASLRAADFAGRHGAASLMVFLAHADAIGAVDALERIRDHLEQLRLAVAGSSSPLTISAGVALLRPSHLDAYVLMADAEAALRAAQAEGGNCVRAAPGTISPGARAARSR